MMQLEHYPSNRAPAHAGRIHWIGRCGPGYDPCSRARGEEPELILGKPHYLPVLPRTRGRTHIDMCPNFTTSRAPAHAGRTLMAPATPHLSVPCARGEEPGVRPTCSRARGEEPATWAASSQRGTVLPRTRGGTPRFEG